MKEYNITLIEDETYFTKFGSKIEKLKLEKIHHEKISGDNVFVTVKSHPENSNNNSWGLWSNEIYHTRKEAKESKN